MPSGASVTPLLRGPSPSSVKKTRLNALYRIAKVIAGAGSDDERDELVRDDDRLARLVAVQVRLHARRRERQRESSSSAVPAGTCSRSRSFPFTWTTTST